MENMRSLADQIRDELVKPAPKAAASSAPGRSKKDKAKTAAPDILTAILKYDNSANKNLVHVRFDPKTVQLMNRFKMAAGVDVTRLVAFSVRYLFDQHPELKDIIKQFIQNTDL